MSSKFVSINRGEALFMSSVGVITDGYHFYTFTTIGGGPTVGTDLPATPTWGYSASEPVDLTGYSLSVSVMTGGGKQINYGLDSPVGPFTGHNSEENVLGFGVQVGLTHTKFTGGPYWRLDGQSGLPTAGELSWYYGKFKDPLKDNPDFAPVVSGIDLINHEMTGGLNGTQSIDQINPFSVFSYVGGPASDVSGISLAYGSGYGGTQSADQFDPFAAYGATSIDPSTAFGPDPINSATVYPNAGNVWSGDGWDLPGTSLSFGPGSGDAWDVPGTSLSFGSGSGGSSSSYDLFDTFGAQGVYDTGSINQLTTYGTDPSDAWASASDWSSDPVMGAGFDGSATGVAGVGFDSPRSTDQSMRRSVGRVRRALHSRRNPTASAKYEPTSHALPAQNPARGLPSGRALPKRRHRSVVRPVLASLQQTAFKGRDAKMRTVSATGARAVQILKAAA